MSSSVCPTLSYDAGSMSGMETEVDEENWAQATSSSSSRWNLNAGDAALLVKIVKIVQKRGIQGQHGIWTDFAKIVEKSELCDPARHDWTVLAAFLESITDEGSLDIIDRHVKWERQIQAEEDELLSARMRQGGNGTAPPQGSAWQLVQRTAAHVRYHDLYTFPSYEDGWHRTPRQLLDYSQEPVLVALDCEMCATTDDDRALLGLCLLDVNGEVLVQETVKPAGVITDLRTHVTGVTSADLEGVTCDLAAAQAAMLACLAKQESGRQVVMVGHALHHDLRALKLDFLPVIDTSLVTSYRGLPEATPALTALASAFLNRQLRLDGAIHDVADDARAALDVALYEIQKGPSPELEPPLIKVPEAQMCKLLAHSLPPDMTDAEVAALFPSDAPMALSIERQLLDLRKALLVFANVKDAMAAFKALVGVESPDSTGRPQKVVTVPRNRTHGGAKVRVRQMDQRNGQRVGKARPAPEGVVVSGVELKRRKT